MSFNTALNDIERKPEENASIGLTICHTDARTVVQYTLKAVKPPDEIGSYSHYARLAALPPLIAPYLPSETEIQRRLAG